jgi:two-component system, OmpR family, phosphate regulon sensor histidine kinase PhoR
MNSIPNNDLSLYQLIKNSDPPPLSIGISPQALKVYLETIADVSIEQQVKVTILLKSSQSQNWTHILKKCQERANLESIYRCRDAADSSNKQLAEATLANSQTIPLILPKNSLLKKECFFLILATEFCALVLSQWQKGQIEVDSFGKRLQQPYLETIISFESALIKQFVTELTKAIATNHPDFDLALPDFEPKLAQKQPNLQTKLLTNLLVKQIIKEDSPSISPTQQLAKDLEPETPSLATALGLQPDFLRNLIEELRSPITYMKTTIGLLESKQIKGEQRQRYFQMLEKQCDRQNSVISGLLEFLQLDVATEVDRIYLNEFVPGIVSTYQPLANENNIQLGYTIPADLPPVTISPSWLRQIIIQLLNNSLQFTPPQGKVFVQAVFKDLNVELTIGDTGRGIDPQELSKIFDSFYRTKTISNKLTTGAGLGLTIVRQLVEKSGGEIFATSKLGKGSIFRILLPALPLELV